MRIDKVPTGDNPPESLNVIIEANELSTATVQINTADGAQNIHKFSAYSTGFYGVIGGQDNGGEMPCGIATVQIKLTDQTGKKGYTDAKPVLLAGDECEADD